jgi:hypothetical protein
LAFHSGREADHSPPSSAEVKVGVELYLHSPNPPSRCCAQLKHRDNFTLPFSLLRGAQLGGAQSQDLVLYMYENGPA